jgi:hypothetical protein
MALSFPPDSGPITFTLSKFQCLYFIPPQFRVPSQPQANTPSPPFVDYNFLREKFPNFSSEVNSIADRALKKLRLVGVGL